jgi:hypothetical protein
MKFKKITINVSNKQITYNDNCKYLEVCEKCRNKHLGKYDSYGNCITWKKISYENCYCKLLT